MRVQELARDLGVEADTLIALLRQMGIPVTGARSAINDAQQAKVLAKIERERRAGHSDPAKAIQAVLEEASPAPSRRRRRRRASEVPPPEPEVTESDVESAEEGAEVGGMPEQEDTTVADPSAPETRKDEEDSESEDLDLGIQASPEATEVLEDLGELESDEEELTETDSALDENEGSQVSEAIEGEIEVQDRSAPDKAEPLESAREGGPVRKIRQPTPSPSCLLYTSPSPRDRG